MLDNHVSDEQLMYIRNLKEWQYINYRLETVGGKKGNRTEPNQRIIPDGAYENFRLLRYRVLPPSPNRTQRMRYLLVILSLFLFSLLN